MSLEERVTALERRRVTLEAIEGVRRTLSLYARALDERRLMPFGARSTLSRNSGKVTQSHGSPSVIDR